MPRYTEDQQAEALTRLHDWLKPGDTVYTVLDHVSASGMSRAIRVLLLSCENGKVVDLHPNHAVSRVLGLRFHKRHGRETDALVMGGCGMDMGFELVYQLSCKMFPDGFGCIGEGCPSNDHSNGDRDYTPHPPLVVPPDPGSHWHGDGGYALRHRWL
jgi:hypothetical protein